MLVLINSVLSSLSLFMLSFFEIPKGVLEKIDYFCSRFFFDKMIVKRSIDSQSEVWCVNLNTKGGLRIQNLEIQNQYLLSKMLFKLINEGLW
jgi:hypothetical protein